VAGGVRTTISTTELRMAQSRINIEEENRKLAQEKRTIASDSLQKFQLQVLELDNNAEIAGELGPLQYLSGLTGTPMDKIINILLLIIIFVFDPLAISLVVAANFAFDKAYPKKLKNLYGEEEHPGDFDVIANSKKYFPDKKKAKGSIPNGLKFNKEYTQEEVSNAFKEMDEKRMDIIGQNGNDGLHYGEEFDEDHALDMVLNDMVKDMEVVDEEEIKKELQRKIKSVQSINNSTWRIVYNDNSIEFVEK